MEQIYRGFFQRMARADGPASDNEKEQTVYVPRSQLLSPNNLTTLMTRFSRQEVILYAQ